MGLRLQRLKANVNDTNDRLSDDLKDLVAASEELLRSTASYAGDEVDGARAKLKRQLDQARGAANGWQRVAAEKAGRLSAVSNEYVHENTWKSIGIAALVGAAISLLVRGNRD
jgi:ElaB/YqjD/DUF883 family membrane-anchored ribosome-binding protein